MDFEFSEEQEQLRETVRRFLAERASIATVRELFEDERGTNDEIAKGCVELGLTGILVPEEFGGTGLGMLEMGVVLEEMGRMVHPGPFFSSSLGAVSLLRQAATRDECAELLPGLADGGRIGTLALYEPGTRYRWNAPHMTVRKTGAGFELSGSKTWVADAIAADLFLVTAETDEGLGVFAVDRDSNGLEATATPTIDGTRKFGELCFSDTPARRLGSGDARAAIATTLDLVNVGLALDGVGAAARALELALAYAREREQFGVPIGSFQAVQHLLCDMLFDLELGRAGAYYALWAADEDPTDFHRVATMAKAYAGDAFPRIAENAIQVFAGVGYTWEYDIHLYYKRLLTLQHTYGDVSEHLEELAKIIIRP